MSYRQSAPLSTDQPRGEGEKKGLGLMNLLTVYCSVFYKTISASLQAIGLSRDNAGKPFYGHFSRFAIINTSLEPFN